jgi:transcriptional regulator GlxA family with amidase domain
VGPHRCRLEGRWFWTSYPGPRIGFHAAPPHPTWVHRYLAFRGPVVEQWRQAGLFPLAPQHVAADSGQEYARRFDELLELSRRTDHWGHARAALALETILTELAEARARPRETPAWLEPALARMQSLDAPLDQLQLAQEAGMPPRTFRRRFAAAMGCSPQRYLIQCRLGHAREMLGNTDLPIKTIAAQLGYADVSFFTRQFRALAGVSPAAYRRSREA